MRPVHLPGHCKTSTTHTVRISNIQKGLLPWAQAIGELYLECPFTHFSIVHKELGDLHVLGDGDVELDAAAIEVPIQQQLPELLVEGA